MALRTRTTGKKVTYKAIYEAKGISSNTLSKMAQNNLDLVGIDTIEKLCDYFDCEPGDLIVRVKEK